MNMINKEEIFAYLDALRESGVTNMFGAAPYIEDMFELNRQAARSMLMEWMETFDKRHPRSE